MKTQKWNTRLASYERKLMRKIGKILKTDRFGQEETVTRFFKRTGWGSWDGGHVS